MAFSAPTMPIGVSFMNSNDLHFLCRTHRVPYYRREEAESGLQVRGQCGRIYIDQDRLTVEFTDGPSTRPLISGSLKRRYLIQRLRKRWGCIRVELRGQFDFTAQIRPRAFCTAVRIIGAFGKRREDGAGKP